MIINVRFFEARLLISCTFTNVEELYVIVLWTQLHLSFDQSSVIKDVNHCQSVSQLPAMALAEGGHYGLYFSFA